MERFNCTPWELFKSSVKKFGDNIMLIYNGMEFTYEQVDHKIQRFGEIIQEIDFTVGGIYLPNCTEFISCMLAFNKSNKVVVPLSYQFKGEVLQELLNYADIDLLITDQKGYNEVQRLEGRVKINTILVLQGSDEFIHYQFAYEKKPTEITGKDVFCICFTSGSTSKPKGIVLSNSAVTGNALAVAQYIGFESEDRTIIPRSLAQASPITGDILMAISKGGTIIILNDLFHPAIFLKSIQDYKATNVFMIRTMLSQILEYPQLHSFDISSMKRIMLGGMLNPGKIFLEAMDKLPGIDFYNAYGLSEASARVSFLGPKDIAAFPGSIGRPMRGCSIKIYREDGSEANTGEIGEIYVTSDYVMNEYYKSEELTSQTITKKGLRTRDKGYRNEHGLFYVVGRSDDLIIQGGSKVYPVEIEEVLMMNPNIKEVVVLGLNDEKLGQKIVALVRGVQDRIIEPQEVFKWCRANLEDKKIPKDIQVVDKIPRNAFGKVSKSQLEVLYNNLILNRRVFK